MFEPISDIRLQSVRSSLERGDASGWITSATTVGELLARLDAAEGDLAAARIAEHQLVEARAELAAANAQLDQLTAPARPEPVAAKPVTPVPDTPVPPEEPVASEAPAKPAEGG